ncbi:sulfite exporter TauE/SafE family protein [Dechloromonas sp. ZY10]|uniref:sulfite exporter TauE/SafE family protein n=1 Tax=Dechloromonas aquae TaxID=2664436 RepID=UPI0035280533
MSLFDYLLVAASAFLAGNLNAIAGGGSFFSFPALLAVGLPPVTANASNAVALWPASLSSAFAYRHEVRRSGRQALALMFAALTGGMLGGLLLLATSNAAFARLIPWLLLLATGLFAFSAEVNRLVKWVQARLGRQAGAGVLRGPGWLLLQLVVAIYGGFFGAGLGILTLAALSIQGYEDMQELNALKNLCSAVNYSVAALTFIVAGAISWPHTLVALLAATAGGFTGVLLARRIPTRWLRRAVVIVGSVLSMVYFVKGG